jgi:hypothetical protein
MTDPTNKVLSPADMPTPQPHRSRRSDTAAELEQNASHGRDDDEPEPTGGGAAVAMAVPEDPDVIYQSGSLPIAAIIKAAEDISRGGRNMEIIRYPLESLARSVASLARDNAELVQEVRELRKNLTPPFAMYRLPGPFWQNVMVILWRAVQGVIVALAVMQATAMMASYVPEFGAWLAAFNAK